MSNAPYKADLIDDGPPPQTSGKAIASLVLGLFSFCLLVFAGLPALILGILALGDIGRSQGKVTGRGLATAGIVLGAFGIVATMCVPIMAALLLPAVQAAREAAREATRRNGSIANMRQINLGMLNYESAKQQFPGNIRGDDGQDTLSWRVELLPYLEEMPLYGRFQRNEPWDSPHNQSLAEPMPGIFACPNFDANGRTNYLRPVGPGTLMEGPTMPGAADITDGLTKTIVLVEANEDRAVVWTRPADFDFDPRRPMDGLGELRPGGFLVIFADGHTQFISKDIDPSVLRALFTYRGGEQVNMLEVER